MCFKREKGIHFITSRSYYYSFGFRYYGIRVNKKTDRLLIVDLKSDKGEITLTFFDLTNNKEQSLVNPESGSYSFKIKKDCKARLVVKTHAHCGHYKVTTKDVEIDYWNKDPFEEY